MPFTIGRTCTHHGTIDRAPPDRMAGPPVRRDIDRLPPSLKMTVNGPSTSPATATRSAAPAILTTLRFGELTGGRPSDG